MRNYEEIINNGKLQILTKMVNDEGEVQIRANYTDPVTQKRYWCKFTKARGWEHLTISGRNKVPDWDVMCKAKEIFWEDEECCIQYHPRKSQYVNNSENCLHIWRPLDVELPEPDTLLVGLQGVSSDEQDLMIKHVLGNMTLEEQLALADKIGIKLNHNMRKALKK